MAAASESDVLPDAFYYVLTTLAMSLDRSRDVLLLLVLVQVSFPLLPPLRVAFQSAWQLWRHNIIFYFYAIHFRLDGEVEGIRANSFLFR